MLLVCQFPVCDARPFAAPGSRLAVPSWPVPITPSFVRCFGRVARRLSGGHAAFNDETFYASAHNAFRFDRLETRRLIEGGERSRTTCAFRRLHSDGLATVRIEVGLAVAHGRRPLTGEQARSLAANLLELPVLGRTPEGASPAGPFGGLGSHLAKLYLAATTPLKPAPPALQAKLVAAGEVLILLDHAPDELTAFPKGARELETAIEGVRLAFSWFTHGDREFGIWFLQGPPKDAGVRRLRLGLMRMHAEHQALKQVLALLKSGTLKYVRGSAGSDLLDTYLGRVSRFVSAADAGTTEASIREVLHAYHALANPDELALLAQLLADARRQIRRNFMDYVETVTRKAGPPVRVFVSYSHQDKKYRKSLLEYLSGLEASDNVTFWHDERLRAGELWDEELRRQMEQADVALVLVSQDFLNSKYCREVEVETFLAARRSKGLIILPVILSNCDWRSHAWLTETQFLPADGHVVAGFYARKDRRDAFYLTVLEQLRDHARTIRARTGVA